MPRAPRKAVDGRQAQVFTGGGAPAPIWRDLEGRDATRSDDRPRCRIAHLTDGAEPSSRRGTCTDKGGGVFEFRPAMDPAAVEVWRVVAGEKDLLERMG